MKYTHINIAFCLGSFAGATAAFGQPTVVDPGLAVTLHATLPDDAFAVITSEGGDYPSGLFVSSHLPNMRVLHVDDQGVVSVFADILPSGGSGPDGFAFGAGTDGWSSGLFLGQNQFQISEIGPTGLVSQFSSLGDLAGPLERGLGCFGNDMYFGGRSGSSIRILASDGSAGSFTTVSSGVVESLVFVPDDGTSADTMYVAITTESAIFEVNCSGQVSPLASVHGAGAGLVYDDSGVFGGGLLAGSQFDERIYHVSLNGDVSVFAEGFVDISSSEAMTIGQDGALYVADTGSEIIWRIAPASACAPSNREEIITIDGCSTGVANVLFDDGCTMSDLIQQCADDAMNHGDFVSCVAQLTNTWKQDGLISGQDKGRIQSCAAQSDIGDGCSDDADCDDGEFCNGVELCLDGDCITGDPCPDQACDEATDSCVE